MALDFPASPTVGQLYPDPAQPGVPQWRWDGTVWTTGGYDPLAYVQKSGDVMTGNLVIRPPAATAYFALDKPPGYASDISGKLSGVDRWRIRLIDNLPESGSNSGSNFRIYHYADNGALLGEALAIERATGLSTVTGDPTAPLGIATKQYADARAVDVMAYSGMQINGAMEVSQENGTTPVSTNAKYVVDGWMLNFAGTMNPNTAQYTGLLASGFPLNNALITTIGSAQPTLGAGDLLVNAHRIEGYRTARLRWGTPYAAPITIGFWSSHAPAGTYSGTIRNFDASRSYVFTYTQNTPSTAEYKTITIPGDTSGTWKYDNSIGLSVSFCFACGTANATASINQWLSGNMVASTNQVNGAASTSNVFRITGVIVLPGIYAPTAAQSPLIMRPYDQELLTCQRYLYRRNFASSNWIATLQAFATTAASGPVFEIPVAMRTTPSITTPSVTNFSLLNAGAGSTFPLIASSNLVWQSGSVVFSPGNIGSASLVVGDASLLAANTSTYIQADARL